MGHALICARTSFGDQAVMGGASAVLNAVPGKIFKGACRKKKSVAWGINRGRHLCKVAGCERSLANRWFEPARRIPVRIEVGAAWTPGRKPRACGRQGCNAVVFGRR